MTRFKTREDRTMYAYGIRAQIMEYRDEMTVGAWYAIKEGERKRKYKLLKKYGWWGLFEDRNGIRAGFRWQELMKGNYGT